MILSDSKFRSVVMARPRIKIHQSYTLFNTSQKTIKRKTGQHQKFYVLEELMSPFISPFDSCVRYHVEAVLNLGPYLISQVI